MFNVIPNLKSVSIGLSLSMSQYTKYLPPLSHATEFISFSPVFFFFLKTTFLSNSKTSQKCQTEKDGHKINVQKWTVFNFSKAAIVNLSLFFSFFFPWKDCINLISVCRGQAENNIFPVFSPPEIDDIIKLSNNFVNVPAICRVHENNLKFDRRILETIKIFIIIGHVCH